MQLGVDLEVLEQQLLQVSPRGADLGIATQIESQINSAKQAASLVESSENSTTDFVSAEISARFCALLFAWIEPRKLGRVIGDRTEFHLPDGEVLFHNVINQTIKRCNALFSFNSALPLSGKENGCANY